MESSLNEKGLDGLYCMMKCEYCGGPYGCVQVISSKKRYIAVNIPDKTLTSRRKHKRMKYEERV